MWVIYTLPASNMAPVGRYLEDQCQFQGTLSDAILVGGWGGVYIYIYIYIPHMDIYIYIYIYVCMYVCIHISTFDLFGGQM